MATNRRNKYTQEFKEEAVKLVTELGYSLSDLMLKMFRLRQSILSKAVVPFKL